SLSIIGWLRSLVTAFLSRAPLPISERRAFLPCCSLRFREGFSVLACVLHTHTHTHTHMQRLTHTHTCRESHIHTCRESHTHTYRQTHKHTSRQPHTQHTKHP